MPNPGRVERVRSARIILFLPDIIGDIDQNRVLSFKTRLSVYGNDHSLP